MIVVHYSISYHLMFCLSIFTILNLYLLPCSSGVDVKVLQLDAHREPKNSENNIKNESIFERDIKLQCFPNPLAYNISDVMCSTSDEIYERSFGFEFYVWLAWLDSHLDKQSRAPEKVFLTRNLPCFVVRSCYVLIQHAIFWWSVSHVFLRCFDCSNRRL